ncbi:hypothetical protein GYMLUDRAFT_47805 [Collybiopsis luxurians FD-317 M1]|uniref:Unplaced genomic scaffold GYMLUscaffold_57, whole genome shotgun sequence n=1 Tax=Collybiopsis luxurians FD-317 M1 TaxID=944289 RepID=A0A0D0AY84_9AGAR|nr:hypothetical protein GYMLUDRAFT_47805 [Collybiopsis luxurians FD-317 M1]
MPDYYLTKNSTYDTTIVRRGDNVVEWIIEGFPNATVYKSPNRQPIGIIKLRSFQEDTVEIRGKSVLPQRAVESNPFSNSREFHASNGRRYKWKSRHPGWELFTQDGRHTLVARFNHKSIFVDPQALEIADEVIATLFYLRQLSLRRARNSSMSANLTAQALNQAQMANQAQLSSIQASAGSPSGFC